MLTFYITTTENQLHRKLFDECYVSFNGSSFLSRKFPLKCQFTSYKVFCLFKYQYKNFYESRFYLIKFLDMVPSCTIFKVLLVRC